MRLFEISGEIRRIIEEGVDHETGEIQPKALEELDALEMARDAKALAIAAFAKEERAIAEAIKAEAQALTDRYRRHENRAERLREHLEEHIPQGTKIEGPEALISWRKSQAVEVLDEKKIPEKFWRVPPPEIGKKMIADEFRAGREVPGAQLVSRTKLSIK